MFIRFILSFSLTEQLESIQSSFDEKRSTALQAFLEYKKVLLYCSDTKNVQDAAIFAFASRQLVVL